jgi:serine/threonine protein kinase
MLGKGGMGVVYKALDRRMHREVAIKMLLESGQQSDEKIERFRREAIAAARMNHPNIVTAYAANEHEGYPYLVMEYIKGRDLGSLVKKGDKLPIPEAVNYIMQTAVGMSYAHSRHIIHRDLKPSNLLLATPDDSDIRPGQYSRVKILDMGLARLTQPQGEVVSPALEGSDLSATGMLMGTVDYMAPEQAMDTKRADHRSDIYSLGCTLYFLLTKRPVFTGTNLLERISAHLKAEIPSLRDARPDVPEDLDAVFQKMVAKEPAERFQSMAEVVDALQQIDRKLSGFGSGRGQRVPWARFFLRFAVGVRSGFAGVLPHDCLRVRSRAGRSRFFIRRQHDPWGRVSQHGDDRRAPHGLASKTSHRGIAGADGHDHGRDLLETQTPIPAST